MERKQDLDIIQTAIEAALRQEQKQCDFLKKNPSYSPMSERGEKEALGELYQRLPDSKLRRAQMALSPQPNWIAPEKRPKPKEADANLFEKLVIDPSRVPMSLAVAFGGRKSIPKNDVDRLALQTNAIPYLFQALETAAPLKLGPRMLGFHRILVLEEPAGFEGKFLVFLRDPKNPSLYSIEIVEDLHSLIRQYHHILQGYKVDPFNNVENPEKMNLREKELHLNKQIEDIHRYVLKNSDKLRKDPKLLEQYRERAMGLAGAYTKVRNSHKRKAVDRLSKAADPKDSLGRLNLQAKLAQLIGSLNDLVKRTDETQSIETTLTEQNKQVEELMWQCTSAFKRFNLLFRNHPTLKKGFSSNEEVDVFLNLLDEEGVSRKALARQDRFSFQPFKTYKEHLLPLVHVIEGHRNAACLPDSNQALFGIYLLTKLWQYHNSLDNLLFDLNIRGKTFDAKKVHAKLSENLATFPREHHKVMPQERFPEFDEIYAEVQALFTSLQSQLQDCETLPAEKRLVLSDEIKKFGLLGRVQALPLPHDIVSFTWNVSHRRIQETLKPPKP